MAIATYPLVEVQARIKALGRKAFTSTALGTGQDELDMTVQEMIDFICAQKPQPCYKTQAFSQKLESRGHARCLPLAVSEQANGLRQGLTGSRQQGRDLFEGVVNMKPMLPHTQPCPVCEVGQLHHHVQDVSITRRGLTAVVPAVAGWFCDACAEIDFDERTDSGERYAQAGDALVLQARAAALKQGQVLKAQRTKLNITQAQASEIAGGGHNAFSRYETGAAQPVAAVLHLFALLERHPELLDETRELVKASRAQAAS
jgi:HTH-type transcriptional regulator/antitoxin MqsA